MAFYYSWQLSYKYGNCGKTEEKMYLKSSQYDSKEENHFSGQPSASFEEK